MHSNTKDLSKLEESAQTVLLNNWREGYTIPSPKLYPFQWLWDSGFIALGYAHFDTDKAIAEIRSLFKGQWKNGMIPHIIFHKESDAYFPGPEVWQTTKSSDAPQNPKTSGITQPPVIGFILERMYRGTDEKQRMLDFIKEILPELEQFHAYFYENRDPNDEGLVYIRHNWESGLDNAVAWDEALNNIAHSESDLSAVRKDLEHIDPSERPGNKEYQQYLALVKLYADCNYNEQQIYENCPFIIQDVLTNALLIESNKALSRLSELVGADTSKFDKWARMGTESMNQKLWDDNSSTYLNYDLHESKTVAKTYLPGFAAALFAEIPTEKQLEQFITKQVDAIAEDVYYMLPTEPPSSPSFNPRQYWRGPVWININWLFYNGLKKYGRNDLAEQIKQNIFQLIQQYGFYEYYNPVKKEGEGYGTDQFSWSAALFIDLLHQ